MFKTPLPNTTLWTGPTIGLLSSQDAVSGGGWWHDNRILAATGDGIDKEEPRAWDGWWNERIVELIRLSTRQPDALCVLLTGRSQPGFADLVTRMVASKGLEFDMIGLKPGASPTNQVFQSTMHFKQLFLEALMETYALAGEIRLYEDRPKHVKGFRDFFAEYNRKQNLQPTRGPLAADVIQVADAFTSLEPVTEVAEVQHMINVHNASISKQPYASRKNKLRIKKTVFFTSYMINAEDSQKLIGLANIAPNMPASELKYHANNILICPRPCPASILDKVGGMGSKMMWEVNGTACLENSIWAASLRPVPPTATFHTDNPVPLVVIALRKGARPVDACRIENWQPLPPDKCFVFETVVGEKTVLRIEPDDPHEDEYESLFANKASKRKHAGSDDRGRGKAHGHYGGRNDSRGFHSGGRGGSGGQGRGRGGNPGRGHRNGPRGGGRGGRGRGGGFNYRSLDDVEPRSQQGGFPQVEYDDVYKPQQPQGPGFARGAAADASQQGRAPGRPMAGPPSGTADLQNYY